MKSILRVGADGVVTDEFTMPGDRYRAGGRDRTDDLPITSRLRCHCATPAAARVYPRTKAERLVASA
jgi:hypothetical protein